MEAEVFSVTLMNFYKAEQRRIPHDLHISVYFILLVSSAADTATPWLSPSPTPPPPRTDSYYAVCL
jgi:hypothetical protein